MTTNYIDYELFYCPFCGCEKIDRFNCGKRYWAACSKCFAEGPAHTKSEEATKAWNNRYKPENKGIKKNDIREEQMK